MEMRLEMLSSAQIEALRPKLTELFDDACHGNEIAQDEMTGDDVVQLGIDGIAAVFAGTMDGELACAFAVQFHMTNGRKGADMIALAGKHLLKFRAAYWHIFEEWLRANGVQFLDAYTPDKRAEVYMKKFGFNKSCAHLRMNLH